MDSPHQKVSLSELSDECKQLGIEVIGLTEVVNESGELASWFLPQVQRLRDWVSRGAHADLKWMEDQLDKRCDPRILLPNVRSALALWVSHHFPEPREHEISLYSSDSLSSLGSASEKQARVARYAWGRDYHNVLRRVLRRLNKWLKERSSEISSHGSVDTSPVLERAIAERCGVGWIGKSTLLVHPQRGTFGSIAILLTSATFDELDEKHPHRCGTCNECVKECPTGALGPEGLDARLCISYWTIEHRGLIPKHMRPKIGEWVFGCDICQEVCPWTIKAGRTQPSPSDSLWSPQPARAYPDLIQWLMTSDEELDETLKGSPLRRAFPHGLKRNALIVLANLREKAAIPAAIHHLRHKEMSVRGSAAWCLAELAAELDLETSQRRLIIDALTEQLTRELHTVAQAELYDALKRLNEPLNN